MKQWLNEQEALFYTGLKSRTSISEARKKGELPFYSLQGRILYKKSDIDRWVERHLVVPGKIDLQFHYKNRYR